MNWYRDIVNKKSDINTREKKRQSFEHYSLDCSGIDSGADADVRIYENSNTYSRIFCQMEMDWRIASTSCPYVRNS